MQLYHKKMSLKDLWHCDLIVPPYEGGFDKHFSSFDRARIPYFHGACTINRKITFTAVPIPVTKIYGMATKLNQINKSLNINEFNRDEFLRSTGTKTRVENDCQAHAKEIDGEGESTQETLQ